MPPNSNCCSGCSTSCPQAVSTVNLVSNTLSADNALTVTVDNSGSATSTKSVTLQVIDSDGDDVSGNFLIRWWLVDSNDKTARRAVQWPTTPGIGEDQVITGDDGSASISFAHTGGLDEWYFVAELLGLLYIDGPLNLGV